MEATTLVCLILGPQQPMLQEAFVATETLFFFLYDGVKSEDGYNLLRSFLHLRKPFLTMNKGQRL